MEFKAYFIDLDGTLCDGPSNGSFGSLPSNANVDAVNKALETTPMIISTGRSLIDGLELLKLFPTMPYIICGNGAWVYDVKAKKIIVRHLIEKKIVQAIIEEIQSVKNSSFSFLKEEEDLTIYGKNIISGVLTKHGHKNYHIVPNFIVNDFKGIAKMMIYHSPSKIKTLENNIKSLNLNISVVTQGKFALEITMKEATKGYAAEYVCEQLGVDTVDAVHIGDTMNDSTAIDHVGSLIAMKNAKKGLIKLASHIGPHYKPHGLAKVLAGNYKKLKNDDNTI